MYFKRRDFVVLSLSLIPRGVFFRTGTTCKTLGKGRIPFQKAGNALVTPLLLRGSIGGGDHLPSGDCLPLIP